MGELLTGAFPGEEAAVSKKHIGTPVHKLLTVLYGVLFPMCTQLFEANASDDFVQKWLGTTHDVRQKVGAVMVQINLQHAVYESADEMLQVVECTFGLVDAIVQGAEVVASEDECSQQKSIQVKGMFASVLDKAEKLAPKDELCRLAHHFRNSPFLASDGKLMSKLNAPVTKELHEVLTPLVVGVGAFSGFPSTPIRSLKIGKDETSMQRLDIKAEHFGRACQVALKVHDDLLHKQVSYLHGIYGMAKALLAADKHVQESFGPKAKYSQKKISMSHVQCLSALRKAHKQFQDVHAQSGDLERVEASGDHHKCFDGGILTGGIDKSVAEEVARLEETMGDAWTNGLMLLTTGIKQMCPAWQGVRDTLLDHAEVVQQLLTNRDYKKIGGLAGEITEALTLLKGLHADHRGRVVSKDVAQEAKDAMTFGIETVAFTYMCHHLTTVFPTITDLDSMATRVADVKYNIEHNHKVKLTDQMQRWCEEFCEGTRKGTSEEPVLYQVPAPAVPADTMPNAITPAAPASKRRRMSDRLKIVGEDVQQE